jgi:hypothetical protein
MFELLNYEGCGNCQKCGTEFDCKAHSVPVTIKFNKAQKWDCWGRMVTAFRKGDVVKGYAVVDEEKVYCASAKSPLYDDVDDFIALEDIEITT